MRQRDNRTDRKLPLKAEPDVENDREDRAQHRDNPGCSQLPRYRRANHFNAPLLVTRANRCDDLAKRFLLRLLSP